MERSFALVSLLLVFFLLCVYTRGFCFALYLWCLTLSFFQEFLGCTLYLQWSRVYVERTETSWNYCKSYLVCIISFAYDNFCIGIFTICVHIINNLRILEESLYNNDWLTESLGNNDWLIITLLNQHILQPPYTATIPDAWPVHQNSLEDRLQVPSHLVVGSPGRFDVVASDSMNCSKVGNLWKKCVCVYIYMYVKI